IRSSLTLCPSPEQGEHKNHDDKKKEGVDERRPQHDALHDTYLALCLPRPCAPPPPPCHHPLMRFMRKTFSRSISSRRRRMKFLSFSRRGSTLNSSAFTRLLVFSISASILRRDVSNSATSMIFSTTCS